MTACSTLPRGFTRLPLRHSCSRPKQSLLSTFQLGWLVEDRYAGCQWQVMPHIRSPLFRGALHEYSDTPTPLVYNSGMVPCTSERRKAGTSCGTSPRTSRNPSPVDRNDVLAFTPMLEGQPAKGPTPAIESCQHVDVITIPPDSVTRTSPRPALVTTTSTRAQCREERYSAHLLLLSVQRWHVVFGKT